MKIIRGLIIILVLGFIWQSIVWIFQLPDYILPGPINVIETFIMQFPMLIAESIPTIIEIISGLVIAILLGCFTAITIDWVKPLRPWLLPLVVVSQAVPTFALAPLLVLWLGYGMISKIAVTVLMLYFMITSSFYDGLRRTPQTYSDLAQTSSASRWRTMRYIRIPAALPSLASGIRVVTVLAPISALFGEWVGSNKGLGYVMLNANERMQVDVLFAAILMLVIFTLILFFSMSKLLRILIPWQQEKGL